jgi:hypothetical protein
VPRKISMSDIMKYYYPRSLIVISFICTFIASGHFPIHGYLYASALFNLMDITQVHFWRNVNFWNFMLITLAVVGGIA